MTTRLSQLVPIQNLAKNISKFYGFFSDLPDLRFSHQNLLEQPVLFWDRCFDVIVALKITLVSLKIKLEILKITLKALHNVVINSFLAGSTGFT